MHRRYYFYQTTELVFSPDFQSCVRQFLLLYDLFDFFLDKESRHYNSDPEQTEVTSCYDFVVVVVVVDKNKTPQNGKRKNELEVDDEWKEIVVVNFYLRVVRK